MRKGGERRGRKRGEEREKERRGEGEREERKERRGKRGTLIDGAMHIDCGMCMCVCIQPLTCFILRAVAFRIELKLKQKPASHLYTNPSAHEYS